MIMYRIGMIQPDYGQGALVVSSKGYCCIGRVEGFSVNHDATKKGPWNITYSVMLRPIRAVEQYLSEDEELMVSSVVEDTIQHVSDAVWWMPIHIVE